MNTPNRFGPANEVRRCARCGQATLVCVREWQHRFAGVDTPTRTFDLECQSCGVKVTLHPQTKIAAERLFAYLMIPAIFPSLYFFASARRKARAWTDNPVVGAAASSPTGPRARQCFCTAAAPCVRIIQRRAGGLPVGTRNEYRCGACSRSFVVPDVSGIVFSFVTASLLSAGGALVIAFPPGSAVGAEQSNQWFGVALVAFGMIAWVNFAFGVRARMIHPEVW